MRRANECVSERHGCFTAFIAFAVVVAVLTVNRKAQMEGTLKNERSNLSRVSRDRQGLQLHAKKFEKEKSHGEHSLYRKLKVKVTVGKGLGTSQEFICWRT